jgi:hypothetical protein
MKSLFERCALVVATSLTMLPNLEAALLQLSGPTLGPAQFSLGTQVAGTVGSSTLSSLGWDASLNANFSVPRFDPGLGTLTGVTFSFASAVAYTADAIYVSNASIGVAGLNFNLRPTITLRSPTSSVFSSARTELSRTFDVGSSLAPVNFSIGSSELIGGWTVVPEGDVDGFSGLEPTSMSADIRFEASATISNGIFAPTPFVMLSMTPLVNYHYTPIPEPRHFSLVVGTLAVAFFLLRRHFRP